MSDTWMGILVLLGGLFTLAAAILDWDWFMNHRKARWIVRLLSRQGARIFYGLLGLLLTLMGLLVTVGIFVLS